MTDRHESKKTNPSSKSMERIAASTCASLTALVSTRVNGVWSGMTAWFTPAVGADRRHRDWSVRSQGAFAPSGHLIRSGGRPAPGLDRRPDAARLLLPDHAAGGHGGLIVGYATQRYGRGPELELNAAGGQSLSGPGRRSSREQRERARRYRTCRANASRSRCPHRRARRCAG